MTIGIQIDLVTSCGGSTLLVDDMEMWAALSDEGKTDVVHKAVRYAEECGHPEVFLTHVLG